MTKEHMKPLVSIIIPTYNRKHTIAQAIQSALDQTYTNTELLIVDDGSTDGTFEYISQTYLDARETVDSNTSSQTKSQTDKNKNSTPHIRIFRKENGGVASARNKGIDEAKGSYIAFLDSDDLWSNTKIEKQIDYLTKHPEYQVVYTDQFLRINGEILPKTRFQRDTPQHKMLYPAFVDNTPIHSSTVMLSKKVIDSVGKFNESLKIHEDSEFWNRISDTFDFGYINEPLATYVWDSDSNHLTSPALKPEFYISGRKYIDLYIKHKNGKLSADQNRL
jgi:glycosyltransferase involved in cell wall biosynthesis